MCDMLDYETSEYVMSRVATVLQRDTIVMHASRPCGHGTDGKVGSQVPHSAKAQWPMQGSVDTEYN